MLCISWLVRWKYNIIFQWKNDLLPQNIWSKLKRSFAQQNKCRLNSKYIAESRASTLSGIKNVIKQIATQDLAEVRCVLCWESGKVIQIGNAIPVRWTGKYRRPTLQCSVFGARYPIDVISLSFGTNHGQAADPAPTLETFRYTRKSAILWWQFNPSRLFCFIQFYMASDRGKIERLVIATVFTFLANALWSNINVGKFFFLFPNTHLLPLVLIEKNHILFELIFLLNRPIQIIKS